MSNASRAADVHGDLGGAATLVFAPGVSTEDEHVCAELLSEADAALVVSLCHGPDNWRASRDHDLPPTHFVTTDSHPDSARTVSDPGDLTGYGIAVSEFLDGLPADAEPAVCLDSVTALLQYADPERAYRFLQVLCGRVLAADGTVHCHVDPAAHDQRVLDLFTGLFDATLTVEE